MTPEPRPAETPPATPNPAEATGVPAPGTPPPGPAPQSACAPEPLRAIRLAAADALHATAQAITDETSTSSLLAAIEQQAQEAARAHGITGAWNLGRIHAAAILAVFATTVTTGEASDAVHERLRLLGTDEVRHHLDAATAFLRP